jgi:GNAT superfamily N-acetyltransferase
LSSEAAPSEEGAAFVRAARASDAPSLARIQVESWRDGLSGLVSDDVLDQLTSARALAEWESRWREAITSPPSSRHRVFVAVTKADPPPSPSPSPAPAPAPSPAPSMSHRPDSMPVDVTSTEGAAGGGAAGGVAGLMAVGFASAGPASDEDRWPATDGQLHELRVLPEHATAGHASRLLHAVADTLAEDGFRTLTTWVLEADSGYREFLAAAGLEPDGARGELDMGKPLIVLRYVTAIGAYGGEQA